LGESDEIFQPFGGEIIGFLPADEESEKQIGEHYTNASYPDVKAESASGRYIF